MNNGYKVRGQRQHGSAALLLLLIVILAAVVVAGYWLWQRQKPAGTGTTNNSAAVSTAIACGHLSLSKGTSDGTAGTIYWHAVLTNNGPHYCQLTGYPAAFMSDAASVSVGAASNALYQPVAVTLAANGGKAHAVIGLPDPGNFDPGSVACTVAASSKLQLYLPGLAAPVAATFGEAACPGFSVTALQPGV